MMYGLETMALRKGQEAEMVAELKMFGFSLGVARLGKIRKEQIGGRAQVEQMKRKLERQG